jgi:hypothetical protein
MSSGAQLRGRQQLFLHRPSICGTPTVTRAADQLRLTTTAVSILLPKRFSRRRNPEFFVIPGKGRLFAALATPRPSPSARRTAPGFPAATRSVCLDRHAHGVRPPERQLSPPDRQQATLRGRIERRCPALVRREDRRRPARVSRSISTTAARFFAGKRKAALA